MRTTNSLYQPPSASELDVLHIDDALLVLNKPAGLLSVPGRGADKQDSLTTRVQAIYPDALVVHRLDMDTSGLVLMALSQESQRQLNHMFSERQVEKQYTAIVSGLVQQDKGQVELPLISDWPNRPRQMVDHMNGKPALTLYKVMSRDAHTNTTRIQLKPVTGRSHQLRVHMQALGHPIIGDPLYANDDHTCTPRMMLHASALGLKHPVTQARLKIQHPPDF